MKAGSAAYACHELEHQGRYAVFACELRDSIDQT
jgi:hypothetical protein